MRSSSEPQADHLAFDPRAGDGQFACSFTNWSMRSARTRSTAVLRRKLLVGTSAPGDSSTVVVAAGSYGRPVLDPVRRFRRPLAGSSDSPRCMPFDDLDDAVEGVLDIFDQLGVARNWPCCLPRRVPRSRDSPRVIARHPGAALQVWNRR